MRRKQTKLGGLILAVLIGGIFLAHPCDTKAFTYKNGIIYVTNKDVKNGKVLIVNKKAKSIVIRKNVKKAFLTLKSVKLSNDIVFEKGNYVLKTSNTNIKAIKIIQKDTNVKLHEDSNLNNTNLTLKVSKGATGSIDLSEYGKELITKLEKRVNFNIIIGNDDAASVVIKKADITSKLKITGQSEDSAISKIKVENPVKLTVNVDTGNLVTDKKAGEASINIKNNVDKIKNEAKSEIKDKDGEKIKDGKIKEDKKEDKKDNKDKIKKDNKNNQNNKSTPSGGSSSGGSSGGSSSGGSSSGGSSGGSSSGGSSSGSSNPGHHTPSIPKKDVLEEKIDKYLKNTEDSINKDNYEEIENTGKELLTKIAQKINENKAPEKAKEKQKWEGYKTKVQNKNNDLNDKINEVKREVDQAKVAIQGAYGSIESGSNISVITAKEKIDIIERNRSKISQKAFKDIVDETRYGAIKKEVDVVMKIAEADLDISDKGILNVPSVATTYELYKVNSSGNQKIKDGQITVDMTTLDLRQEMRKSGVGQYYVKIKKTFDYLAAYEKDSSMKDVILLSKNWAVKDGASSAGSTWPPAYKYDGTTFTKDTTGNRADTIRLKENGGKWQLEWDAVSNATSYLILATVSYDNSEATMGSYNLKSTADDYANIENEFAIEELSKTSNAKIYENKNKGTNARSVVDLTTTTTLDLEKLVPVKAGSTKETFWEENKDALVAVDIYIIPRNENSLYVSNMSDYFNTENKNKQEKNKFFIYPDNFKIKNLYKVLYGEKLTD